MYVIIVGAGDVGSYAARILVDEGHDVAIVEEDEDLCRRLDASLNALVINGSGVDPGALRRAGVEGADLVLAVTSLDEVNLIACMTARKYGGKKLGAVARVRQQHVTGGAYLSAVDLGLDALISPEEAIADNAMDILHYVGTGEVRELIEGKLVLVGMVLGQDSPFVHETLAQLRGDLPAESLVVAVQGREGVRIPTGADQLKPDERAFILTLPQHLTELSILSGRPWHRVQRVLIVGCGNTGLALARQLEAAKFHPTIVERRKERAEEIAAILTGSLVLHGDGADPEMLRSRIEEEDIDAVAVLLKNPEESLLIGIFAKSLGAKKVVVRCDKPAYAHLADGLGVDAIISPKRAIANAILRYVSRGQVGSAVMLGEHEVEIVEFLVPDDPSRDLVRKPLKDVGMPKDTLVGAVDRNGTVSIPSGGFVLQPRDRLFVVCRPQVIGKVEKLFA